MARIFLIHGAYGNPSENWFPWLKKELEKLDHEVIIPTFPTPDNQSISTWLQVFEPYKDKMNHDSICIGHSLGATFILSILEQSITSIKGTFLVSGFISNLENETFDSINKTFIEKGFNWVKIKENCGEFFMYHGDNDPYVSISKSQELEKQLGVKAKIITGAGHFNDESGFSTFEELLIDVKRIV